MVALTRALTVLYVTPGFLQLLIEKVEFAQNVYESMHNSPENYDSLASPGDVLKISHFQLIVHIASRIVKLDAIQRVYSFSR